MSSSIFQPSDLRMILNQIRLEQQTPWVLHKKSDCSLLKFPCSFHSSNLPGTKSSSVLSILEISWAAKEWQVSKIWKKKSIEDCFMLGEVLNLEFPDFKFLGNASKRKVDTAWSIIPTSKWLITTVIVSLPTLTWWDDPPSGTKFNNQIHLITRKFEETDSSALRPKFPGTNCGKTQIKSPRLIPRTYSLFLGKKSNWVTEDQPNCWWFRNPANHQVRGFLSII